MKNTKLILSSFCKIAKYCYVGIKEILKDNIIDYVDNIKIERFLQELKRGQLLTTKTNSCVLLRIKDEQYKYLKPDDVILILEINPLKRKLVCLYKKDKYEVLHVSILKLNVVFK